MTRCARTPTSHPTQHSNRKEPQTPMKSQTLRCGLAAALALLVTACAGGPRARVMADSDQDLVGTRAAGAETFDRLISGSVEKLLSSRVAAMSGLGTKRIAILPVENKSAEELGDWRDQIYELIATSINQSQRFKTISPNFVSAALREARIQGDDLYLPRGRRALAAALEQKGAPVDMMMVSTLTTGTTDPGMDLTQRNYMLSLTLIDIQTGEEEKVATRLRKEYQR